MLRRLLVLIAVLPSLVMAEESLVERAVKLRPMGAERQAKNPALTALELYQFPTFRDLLPQLEQDVHSKSNFEALLKWYLISEDLGALEQWAPKSAYPELAKGELAFSVLNFPEAEAHFKAGLESRDATAQRLGKIGLAKALHKQQKYQEALDVLSSAWNSEQLSDEVLFQAALCKVYLGETSEAIDLAEECLRWNPSHEMGHYYLGNGYARKNYTELEAANASLRCDSTGVVCVRDLVIRGAAEWGQGKYESALEYFSAALEHVPDYGRAQNGVAKCLEQIRLRENVYRQADLAAFDAKSIPKVPLIEQYILNWDSLSDRHKKQVAISVEPWKDYVPVLVACGSHHYIKPLHEKLSEVPGLETMADQRIIYDSRLWDDVRGCGGYTTVTGIEDVERSIYNKYNTVLHELTHQVHGIFPPEDQLKIEDLYREASEKDAAGEEIFVSRYQGSSVWEYFAEGMNSYYSPRRNEYDTREITKERLFALDPNLVKTLEYYMTAPNLEACYPVGFVNAAFNEVEQGNLPRAMEFAKRAEARDPQSEVVLATLSQLSSYENADSVAVSYAKQLVARYPEKSASYRQLAYAKLFTDGDFATAVDFLNDGLTKTSGSEQTQLLREFAGLQVASGKFAEAVVNYRDVLAEQSTDDTALRGFAEALFWAGDLQKADSVYQVALLRRSGVTDLRLEYARSLMLTGRFADARVQIDESELLKPGDGRVAVHRAWLAADAGDTVAARALAMQAVKQYPDDALVQAISANILAPTARPALINNVRYSVPTWVYNKSESSYEARNYWDAPALRLLENGLKLSSK